jgi:ribose 1,5-bisphosphokinase PhnN
MRALGHVLWIGGPSGAGKTAVATRIARRHGLPWYSADTRTWQHRDRALRAGNPAARRWEAMTPQERWVTSTPAGMLAMSLHAERGPMMFDDLRTRPDSPLVLAEGSRSRLAPSRPGSPTAPRRHTSSSGRC